MKALVFVAILSAAALAFWPRGKVVLASAQETEVTETIAASGVVRGWREATVGASVPGTISELLVREGDAVLKGQPLARLRDNVAHAEAERARAGLETAMAGVAQARAGALPSEEARAEAMLREAISAQEQAAALARRADWVRGQAIASIQEQNALIARAGSSVAQAEAKLELAEKTYDRVKKLANEGAIARARLDEAETALQISRSDKTSAEDALAAAKAGLTRTEAGARASEEDLVSARAAMKVARSRSLAARASLDTIRSFPRSVDVAVARRRMREAAEILKMSQDQAVNSHVTAPFDGVVTRILAERGSAVGPAGILRIVERGNLEIRLTLDEANLGTIAVGQRASISHPAYPGKGVIGMVNRIAPNVDEERGTIELTVVPIKKRTWLKPGQTVDVNLVTQERVKRLLAPQSAIHMTDKHAAIYVVEKGRATLRAVVLGPSVGDLVPVLQGLSGKDKFVRDAASVSSGQAVVDK
ncbi:MAG: efflux RND transporter periplasmic adaptor subunit [Fimbriimonadaceae bacterium]